MRKETEMSQESHGMVEMGREWGKGRKERRKEGEEGRKRGREEEEVGRAGGRDCVVSPAPQ